MALVADAQRIVAWRGDTQRGFGRKYLTVGIEPGIGVIATASGYYHIGTERDAIVGQDDGEGRSDDGEGRILLYRHPDDGLGF